MTQEKNPSHDNEHSESERYLMFSLNEVLFATPLMGVREVMEYHTPKPVPNMQKECLGIINMRGEIIPVFEINAAYDSAIPQRSKGKCFMMIVETHGGNTACIVDKIEAVLTIPEKDIDKKHTHSALGDAFCGIAKHKNDLISVINLRAALETTQNLTKENALRAA